MIKEKVKQWKMRKEEVEQGNMLRKEILEQWEIKKERVVEQLKNGKGRGWTVKDEKGRG